MGLRRHNRAGGHGDGTDRTGGHGDGTDRAARRTFVVPRTVIGTCYVCGGTVTGEIRPAAERLSGLEVALHDECRERCGQPPSVSASAGLAAASAATHSGQPHRLSPGRHHA